jgi:DNA-binding MarR family transcriptional regulator
MSSSTGGSLPVAAEKLPALDCACASLRRASRAVTQLYGAALRDSGVTPTQLTLLQALGRLGTVPQGALGKLLVLDPTTLSRTLRPLARAGWIRSAAGRDRRESRWALSARGRRQFERARPVWEGVQRELKARVGGGQWRRLLEDLADVASAAGLSSAPMSP